MPSRDAWDQVDPEAVDHPARHVAVTAAPVVGAKEGAEVARRSCDDQARASAPPPRRRRRQTPGRAGRPVDWNRHEPRGEQLGQQAHHVGHRMPAAPTRRAIDNVHVTEYGRRDEIRSAHGPGRRRRRFLQQPRAASRLRGAAPRARRRTRDRRRQRLAGREPGGGARPRRDRDPAPRQRRLRLRGATSAGGRARRPMSCS